MLLLLEDVVNDAAEFPDEARDAVADVALAAAAAPVAITAEAC